MSISENLFHTIASSCQVKKSRGDQNKISGTLASVASKIISNTVNFTGGIIGSMLINLPGSSGLPVDQDLGDTVSQDEVADPKYVLAGACIGMGFGIVVVGCVMLHKARCCIDFWFTEADVVDIDHDVPVGRDHPL
ncbi:MAG: hypothetical protein P857_386 [Candidatus Xenolissoclinum pacificiensis L6]|uniref:Uncharacterized protein n=1 Tax=Candidatus Xenolissoclinum pacificiensis L6 TaxID=1401685 RepID=W2UZ93_9RICK|nr:MAG: hypothetical protein P857_386 [Candidatus Xenolissoclinum pacificiensis L6]